ncbi:ribosomal protein S18-alanine N-acetyltransferase [Bifidobacterium asteroides]|uniref:ribosomal protein S18-alanine N-acetyltransferase n=1 Tax=Bifidobacterium asteroides TaxID=1684 RepID=UPI003A800C60
MIRRAALGDLDQLVDLEACVFGDQAWSRHELRFELSAPSRTYLVWDGRGAILGYGGYWSGERDAELMTIGVLPEARNRGIAGSLLSRLIAGADREGLQRMNLKVRVDNPAAINLYKDFGFSKTGLSKGYYQPEGVDAWAMTRPLSSVGPGPVGSVGNRLSEGQERIIDHE